MSYVFATKEVAHRMGFPTVEAFRRARPKLEKAGFPTPLPGTTTKYSRSAVEAWVRSNGRSEHDEPTGDGQIDLEDAVSAATRHLEEKYAPSLERKAVQA